MAVDSANHKVDLWSPLQRGGETVLSMPQVVDEKDTPLGSPQSANKESFAEGEFIFLQWL